mmetsp:Transcript_6016/g.12751  ORF Transcript_6016/g.12751 Transcript_6016/m.12751 type:complete len:121 (-) Transcript_6016:173-535(-)
MLRNEKSSTNMENKQSREGRTKEIKVVPISQRRFYHAPSRESSNARRSGRNRRAQSPSPRIKATNFVSECHPVRSETSARLHRLTLKRADTARDKNQSSESMTFVDDDEDDEDDDERCHD